ncbi:aminoglycoside N(6')-acetyltransferase type 1 [Clostridia bacterium]|nr:aminoglycoside N(6')-acetyltransferase type 1 [Clostridia bacterium]
MATCKKATIADLEPVTKLLAILYEARSHEYLTAENRENLTDPEQAMFLACRGDDAIGIAHCALRRDYVEGTDSGNRNGCVGYLEGIFVLPEHRLRGTARELAAECEGWAKAMGCTDFASDCELDNAESCRFHLSVGFTEANRNIHFVKKL